MKRTVEFILGLIGGIISAVVCFVMLMFSLAYGNAYYSVFGGESLYGMMAVYANIIILVLAFLGLFGAIIVKRRTVMGGIFMLVSGVLLLAVSGFPWSILWSAVLIVAGVMACIPKYPVPVVTAAPGSIDNSI